MNIYYPVDTLLGFEETEILKKMFGHWGRFLFGGKDISISNIHKTQADITLKHRKLSFLGVKIVQILAVSYGLT